MFFSSNWADTTQSPFWHTSLDHCTASLLETPLNIKIFGFICLTKTCRLSTNLGHGKDEFYGPIFFWSFCFSLCVSFERPELKVEVVWIAVSSYFAVFSRILQSLTCCLKMPLTSGLLARPQKSVPSSRSSTIPARGTSQTGSQSLLTANPKLWEVSGHEQYYSHPISRHSFSYKKLGVEQHNSK